MSRARDSGIIFNDSDNECGESNSIKDQLVSQYSKRRIAQQEVYEGLEKRSADDFTDLWVVSEFNGEIALCERMYVSN
jgi:hypothetical protein